MSLSKQLMFTGLTAYQPEFWKSALLLNKTAVGAVAKTHRFVRRPQGSGFQSSQLLAQV